MTHAPLVLLLAACSARDPAPPTEPPLAATAPTAPPPADVPASAPAVPEQVSPWQIEVTGAGAAIARVVFGEERVRVACRRDPPTLVVTVQRMAPVPSEERLSFGVGSDVVALVADVAAARPAGVEATGPLPLDLLPRLTVGSAPIGISYGAQVLNLPGPDAATATRFVEACRAVATAP